MEKILQRETSHRNRVKLYNRRILYETAEIPTYEQNAGFEVIGTGIEKNKCNGHGQVVSNRRKMERRKF